MNPRPLILLVALALVACGDDDSDPPPPPADTGPADTGGGDGGPPADTGADTGGDPDTGMPPADSGPEDAGPPDTGPTAPEPTGVAPSQSYYPGGLEVTITGVRLTGATEVTFGGRACYGLTVDSDTQLTCTVPSGAPGSADVVVTTDAGAGTLGGGFTYIDFTRVDTVAGTGTFGAATGAGNVAQFSTAINDLEVVGDILYVADGLNYQVRTVDLSGLDLSGVDPADVTVAVLAGAGTEGTADSSDGTGATATFRQPIGLLYADSALFVSDARLSDRDGALRRVDPTTGATTTSSSGAGNALHGLATDGTNLYATECGARHDISRGALGAAPSLVTWSGTGAGPGDAVGAAGSAQYRCPVGLFVDPTATTLYVFERAGHRGRSVALSSGDSAAFVGSGSPGGDDNTDGTMARFNRPVMVAGYDDVVFVADQDNCAIREVTVSTGAVDTILGSAVSCAATDGNLFTAEIAYPAAVAYDPTRGIFLGGSTWGAGSRDSKPPSGQIRLIH